MSIPQEAVTVQFGKIITIPQSPASILQVKERGEVQVIQRTTIMYYS